jgi:hypothetical protein
MVPSDQYAPGSHGPSTEKIKHHSDKAVLDGSAAKLNLKYPGCVSGILVSRSGLNARYMFLLIKWVLTLLSMQHTLHMIWLAMHCTSMLLNH